MHIVGYILGIILSLACGHLILSTFSARHKPIYSYGEAALLSFLYWSISIGIYMFLLGRCNIPFSLITVYGIPSVIIIIGELWYYTQGKLLTYAPISMITLKNSPIWQKIAIIILALGIIYKLWWWAIAIATLPTYQDDSFVNWNIRWKIFYAQRGLVLDKNSPDYLGRWYRQYPPVFSLYKTFLAIGYWSRNEWVINSSSYLYYIASLCLIFFLILRTTWNIWAGIAGVYMLSAIPLYYIHGTNPYADIFQWVYFALALYSIYLASEGKTSRVAAAFVTGLLAYTKSEWLIIFLCGALVTAWYFILTQRRSPKTAPSLHRYWLPIVTLCTTIAPIIIFKFIYWLGFGNGNAEIWATAQSLTLHWNIFPAMMKVFFYTWAYNLFFITYLIWIAYYLVKRWYTDRSLRPIHAGLWAAVGAIVLVYLTTFTFQYVLDQTGINRSMMQCMLVGVRSCILLYYHCYIHVSKNRNT